MKGLITKTKEEPAGRKVFIIRHGQTKLNAENKIRAWIDVPLDDIGFEQAQDLGYEMVKEEINLDGLVSSDLLRSVQTTLEISKITGIPLLNTTKALRPLNVGTYSGTDGKKAHEVIAEFSRNKPEEPIGGGESFEIFKYRMLGGIIGILNSNRGKVLGLVSHSRGERLLHAWVKNGCPIDLEIDLDEFLREGEGTATAQELIIDCPLILS